MNRYEIIVCGHVVSRHRTERAAIMAAERESYGLTDDGAYCGDDCWPTIVDIHDPDRRIDYRAGGASL